MKEIHAELQKSRRRYHSLVAVFIALVVICWSTQTGGEEADRIEHGYSAFFYAVPVMNTVVMPIGIAVLASRLWDIETKENHFRLLFTMQSRSTLFCSKSALGLVQNLLICAVEGAGLLALGRIGGYAEVLDWTQFWWMICATFAVNMMLFFLLSGISICFQSQVPTLAVGMVGSLSGLFAAFMPSWVGRFMPWGYYIPLSAMYMDWNRYTREVRFLPVSYPVRMMAVTAGLLVVFAAASWQMLRRKEV